MNANRESVPQFVNSDLSILQPGEPVFDSQSTLERKEDVKLDVCYFFSGDFCCKCMCYSGKGLRRFSIVKSIVIVL